MVLAACAGHNEVKPTETYDSKTTGKFTKIVFVEETPTVEVDPGVRAAVQKDLVDYFEKQIQMLQDEYDRAKAQGYLQGLKNRTLTVKYKIVGFEAGNGILRRFLGLFGIGVERLSVEANYVDDKGKVLSTTRMDAAIGEAPHVLNSDSEVLGAMMTTNHADYIIKTKGYLYQPTKAEIHDTGK